MIPVEFVIYFSDERVLWPRTPKTCDVTRELSREVPAGAPVVARLSLTLNCLWVKRSNNRAPHARPLLLLLFSLEHARIQAGTASVGMLPMSVVTGPIGSPDPETASRLEAATVVFANCFCFNTGG